MAARRCPGHRGRVLACRSLFPSTLRLRDGRGFDHLLSAVSCRAWAASGGEVVEVRIAGCAARLQSASSRERPCVADCFLLLTCAYIRPAWGRVILRRSSEGRSARPVSGRAGLRLAYV